MESVAINDSKSNTQLVIQRSAELRYRAFSGFCLKFVSRRRHRLLAFMFVRFIRGLAVFAVRFNFAKSLVTCVEMSNAN